jgi:hypothetical protein
MMLTFAKLRTLLAALAGAALLALSGAAMAEKGLPKPHVSPALDAVLLPITAEVRREFKLGKKAAGVVVVSVDPGGVGELYGLEPGEVLTKLDGKVIRRPVDIDSMIRYKLNDGTNYFFFEGTWKNRKQKTIIELTDEDYVKPVSVADIPRWRGYNAAGAKARGQRGQGYIGPDGYFYGAGGFYYADFCDGYSTDFYEVYDYTLVYVEEIIVTEVYITSIESSDTVFWYDDAAAGYDWYYDDYYIEEVDAYVYSDAFYAEYESTEVHYDDEAYDPETGLSYEEAEAYGFLEPEAYDGSYVDEGYVDEGYVDEGAVDDGYVDESYVDESYVDESYVDEGYVDDGAVYEEPVYEEPAYEEPVYAEPAYEEPVYEEPAYEDYGDGGGCYVDEDGYEVCS